MNMTWRDDLNYGLAAFGIQIPASIPMDGWLSSLGDAPARNAAVVVSAGAVLFLYFEKGHNPSVRNLADAMLYTSACLHVGRSGIQPVTKAGKLLASILMTYGPALAARALDGKRPEGAHDEILETLQQILARLEAASNAAKPLE
jgi:hypothetical protein